MEFIIKEKFTDCLEKYIQHCEETTWIDGETYKFLFANWLNRKVNIRTQSIQKIYELCMQSMKEPYYKNEKGIQFIIRGARKQVSHPISLPDAELFKTLSERDDPTLIATYQRGMSFPVLSAWLGTLLPKKYICAPTTDFTRTIELLFNTTIASSGIDFFNQSQEYFKIIKTELIESGLKQYFLSNINIYLKGLYLNSTEKKKYDEYDWNWVTEDFALYIFREYLNLYIPKSKKSHEPSIQPKNADSEQKADSNQDNSNKVRIEPLDDNPDDPNDSIEVVSEELVDTLENILDIDEKYKNASPIVKEIISKRIERGAFSNKFKQIAGYKCMICERMGITPFSFKKPNGDFYIEVHHVIPVSELVKGSLSSANLITVCANHHRQLHYGNSKVEEIDDNRFIFRIDNKIWNIPKLKALKAKNIND